ncbi:MAG: DUF4863 family protein [Neomegalonema sp.]|nr:DUF4863 family protein [Neomegalonema sp.]
MVSFDFTAACFANASDGGLTGRRAVALALRLSSTSIQKTINPDKFVAQKCTTRRRAVAQRDCMMQYNAQTSPQRRAIREGNVSQERFEELIGEIANSIGDRPLDAALAKHLNTNWPKGGPAFTELGALCAEGEREGWLMAREAGGIKYGRAVKPGASAGGFSVDVVRMRDVKGPHHRHPKGEIGAVFPLEGAPKFDDFPEGWYVYAPNTAHHPTVTGGDAHVLYLLPDGEIEFTK